jgi:hypothetical protein
VEEVDLLTLEEKNTFPKAVLMEVMAVGEDMSTSSEIVNIGLCFT